MCQLSFCAATTHAAKTYLKSMCELGDGSYDYLSYCLAAEDTSLMLWLAELSLYLPVLV